MRQMQRLEHGKPQLYPSSNNASKQQRCHDVVGLMCVTVFSQMRLKAYAACQKPPLTLVYCSARLTITVSLSFTYSFVIFSVFSFNKARLAAGLGGAQSPVAIQTTLRYNTFNVNLFWSRVWLERGSRSHVLGDRSLYKTQEFMVSLAEVPDHR